MQSTIPEAANARRADLDWLRIIAFVLLIYFHAAIAFLPGGIPMIQNGESSPVLQVLVAFLHEFRLALLFLISGVGTCFALKRRDSAQFLRERSVRLLIPLAFGILVLVPPMVHLEKRFLGTFEGSLLDFYQVYFSSGVYPEGHLSWHHFWFLAYLYLFCLLGLPLFVYWKGGAGRVSLAAWSARLSRGAALYLPVLPLAFAEVLLRAPFPGFRDLIHDWASFSHWFLIFVAGFAFASSTTLLDRARNLRRISLVLALLTTSCLFLLFYSPDHGGFSPGHDDPVDPGRYLWFCLVRVANVWLWLVACLGFAGHHLRRPGRLLDYLNEAVYPLFCLHLPIIVALDYVVVPLPWSIGQKYLAITAAALIITFSVYEVVRPIPLLRPLLGLKPKTRARNLQPAREARRHG